MKPKTVDFVGKKNIKNACILKKSKWKYENTTAGHVNPQKPTAFGAWRPASLNKYEEKY